MRQEIFANTKKDLLIFRLDLKNRSTAQVVKGKTKAPISYRRIED